MTCEVEINGRTRRVEIQRADGGYMVSIDGHRRAADVTVINGVWSLILEDAASGDRGTRRSYEIAIVEQPAASGNLTVHVDGRLVTAAVGTARRSWERRAPDAGLAGQGPHSVVAPMPGKVVKVLVRQGDTVTARQGVAVVEAMKMENELRTPKAGTVAEVKVSEGMSVDSGTVLVVVT